MIAMPCTSHPRLHVRHSCRTPPPPPPLPKRGPATGARAGALQGGGGGEGGGGWEDLPRKIFKNEAKSCILSEKRGGGSSGTQEPIQGTCLSYASVLSDTTLQPLTGRCTHCFFSFLNSIMIDAPSMSLFRCATLAMSTNVGARSMFSTICLTLEK